MIRALSLLLSFMLPLLAGPNGIKLEEVIILEEVIAHPHQNSPNQPELTVDLNLHNGKVIVLSDGSTWEVAPQDLQTSQSWIFPSPLTVEKSNNPSYPYKIINQTTNSSVLVRPIAK